MPPDSFEDEALSALDEAALTAAEQLLRIAIKVINSGR